MTVTLLALAVIAAAGALFFSARPVGDVGPWRYDERLRRPEQCRFVSLDTDARCVHRAGHWVSVVPHDSARSVDLECPAGVPPRAAAV